MLCVFELTTYIAATRWKLYPQRQRRPAQTVTCRSKPGMREKFFRQGLGVRTHDIQGASAAMLDRWRRQAAKESCSELIREDPNLTGKAAYTICSRFRLWFRLNRALFVLVRMQQQPSLYIQRFLRINYSHTYSSNFHCKMDPGPLCTNLHSRLKVA